MEEDNGPPIPFYATMGSGASGATGLTVELKETGYKGVTGVNLELLSSEQLD